ncbi:lytB family protein [[Clostridium] sordellii ATCC 9714]|nr:lytB family protein [[Clostridium] sordellii ATCC 9714] [Paeniclostridium sordellii ATCC 9714]
MEVKIAKNAGFCFGVKRAMKMAWDEYKIAKMEFMLLVHLYIISKPF